MDIEITLENIELVKDRTGVSYKEAKEALEQSGGNVVDAIIYIEERCSLHEEESSEAQVNALLKKIKEALHKGNVSKLIVRKGEEQIVSLPLNVGIVGTVLAPMAAVAGLIAVFGTKCTFELVKTDGSVLDITGSAKEGFSAVIEKSGDIAGAAKVKGGEIYQSVKEKAGEGIAKARADFDLDLDMDPDSADGFGCGYGDEGEEAPAGEAKCGCGSGECDGHCEDCEGCCNSDCDSCSDCDRDCDYRKEGDCAHCDSDCEYRGKGLTSCDCCDSDCEYRGQ